MAKIKLINIYKYKNKIKEYIFHELFYERMSTFQLFQKKKANPGKFVAIEKIKFLRDVEKKHVTEDSIVS